jgi:hypothetical protein
LVKSQIFGLKRQMSRGVGKYSEKLFRGILKLDSRDSLDPHLLKLDSLDLQYLLKLDSLDTVPTQTGFSGSSAY